MKKGLKNEAGFTLIELMVVIVLIGILASVGFPYLEKTIDKTRINTDVYQGQTVKKSIDMFYTQYGRMPNNITELVSVGLLKPVATAQKSGGAPVLITDVNYNSNQILDVDLTSGNVQVYDVTLGTHNLVWQSGSN